jgi:predicted nucleic acid-binding protein
MLRWERSGWLDAARAKAAWAKLATLVEIEPASSLDSAADEALALARVERLSLFDAFYLDLAMRLGATLASRDAALLAAAGRRGVPVEDLR